MDGEPLRGTRAATRCRSRHRNRTRRQCGADRLLGDAVPDRLAIDRMVHDARNIEINDVDGYRGKQAALRQQAGCDGLGQKRRRHAANDIRPWERQR